VTADDRDCIGSRIAANSGLYFHATPMKLKEDMIFLSIVVVLMLLPVVMPSPELPTLGLGFSPLRVCCACDVLLAGSN
jgi:hypothetical protein